MQPKTLRNFMHKRVPLACQFVYPYFWKTKCYFTTYCLQDLTRNPMTYCVNVFPEKYLNGHGIHEFEGKMMKITV